MKTNSLRAWIVAVRPYSLVDSLIIVFVATAMAWRDGGLDLPVALLCLVFALLMQCTANLVNDLWDFLRGADQPDRLGPDRAFASGFITMRAMKWGIGCFVATAALVGCTILYLTHERMYYGGCELVAVGAACLIGAFVYTVGRIALAYNGLGDLAVILFFGIVPVGFSYYVQTGAWTWEVTAAALACGLVIDTMLMINNFRDRVEDARCGKRTIVVLLGERFGSFGYLGLGLSAMACALSLAAAGYLWGALLPLPYLVLHIATWRKIVRIDHGDALNICLGETARNIMIFGILLTIGILLG